MDKLSAEILAIIFSYLHREQLLECMLVCRSFANALQNGQHFETIVMSYWPSSDEYGHSFTKLVEQVRAYPSLGRKCRRLVLDGQINISFDKRELGELFPNLDCLFLGTGGLITLMNQTKQYPPEAEIKPDPLKHWKENLKTLFIESEIMFYFDILEHGIFKNLTTLVLGAENELQTMGFGMVFQSLHNTPALKKLVFSCSHVHLFEIETLHKNVPNLESLLLLNSRFEYRGESPENVQPATSLKKFTMKSQSIFFNFPQKVTEYLVKKYPEIEEFTILLNEKYNKFNDDTKRRMESSIKHLLQHFGPKLKKLKLRLPYALTDTIDVLIRNTSQMQELEANAYFGKKPLYKILTYTNNFNLRTLYLTQLPSFQFSVFKNINSLKSLGLVFKDKSKNKTAVNFNSLLKEVTNTLESLEIANAAINLKSEKANPSNISRLILKSSKLPKELECFLTNHFHRLNSLTLSYCEVLPAFQLPLHHLIYFEINILREKEPYCIRSDIELEKYKHRVTHLQVTLGETTCYYRFPTELKTENHPLYTHEYFNSYDHSIRFVSKPTKWEEDLNYFQFKCASAQTIFYNGHLVL